MPTDQLTLGTYLKDRRQRLDAVALGYGCSRRRTAGLRREEVAQRAHISATWYTWLEQGRGGAPSRAVLERLAAALLLTEVEREHLFLLAFGHAPEIRYQPQDGITPRLQKVLDALACSPALIRSATWDVLAWNRAACAVFVDYAALAPAQRNMLRLFFLNPAVRAAQPDWHAVARYVVPVFRADIARAGATETTRALVDELCRESSEFATLWRSNEVLEFGEGQKQLNHALAGTLALEYSTFAVDGRPDLSLLVYTPADARSRSRIQALMDRSEQQLTLAAYEESR